MVKPGIIIFLCPYKWYITPQYQLNYYLYESHNVKKNVVLTVGPLIPLKKVGIVIDKDIGVKTVTLSFP